VIGGDATAACIAAASILAKVTRDRMMVELDGRLPGYGFAAHKGYNTAEHTAALQVLGPTDEHRRTWRNVRQTGAVSPDGIERDMTGPDAIGTDAAESDMLECGPVAADAAHAR
jgi:ribonuclease HII